LENGRGGGRRGGRPRVPYGSRAGTHSGLFTHVASAALLAVIWLFLLQGEESSSFGLATFLIAFSAFGQLVGGVTGLIGAATTLIALVPLIEREKPVLEAGPETTDRAHRPRRSDWTRMHRDGPDR